MRLQSFEQMLPEYEPGGLDPGDLTDRNKLLMTHPHSVILEGEFSELDNLNKWIEINLKPEKIESIYYGKIGYDYGFAEYFFDNELHATQVARVVPLIYTTYPYSASPNKMIIKSNGYEEEVVYDPQDKEAIVF